MKRILLVLSLLLMQGAILHPASPTSGSTTCPTSGAKRVVSTSTPAITATIQVPVGNSGTVIYLGGSTVSTSTGIALYKGDSYTFPAAGNSNSLNLFQVYFVCSANTDTITWIYD